MTEELWGKTLPPLKVVKPKQLMERLPKGWVRQDAYDARQMVKGTWRRRESKA